MAIEESNEMLKIGDNEWNIEVYADQSIVMEQYGSVASFDFTNEQWAALAKFISGTVLESQEAHNVDVVTPDMSDNPADWNWP